jgi:hypothetical protein
MQLKPSIAAIVLRLKATTVPLISTKSHIYSRTINKNRQYAPQFQFQNHAYTL